jgi:hypothetical protein
MNKLFVRVLGIVGIIAALAFFGSSFTTKAVADEHSDDWGTCVSTAQCGTDNGQQTKTEDRSYDLKCPDGYTHDGHNGSWPKDCRKTDSAGGYIYADKVVDVAGHWGDIHNGGCPGNQSSSTCLQTGSGEDKHHQNWIADTFKCPDGYQNNPGHDNCRKWVDPAYSYADKVKEYNNCDEGWTVNPSNESQCIKTRSCQTGTIDNSACETTPTPTPPPGNPGNPGGPGDGLSDGRSDGLSSCPSCTQAPKTNVLGAQTGQVLGATTDFAGTGVANDLIMNVVGAMGGISTASGLVIAAKKKFNK